MIVPRLDVQIAEILHSSPCFNELLGTVMFKYCNFKKNEMMNKKTLVIGASTNPERYSNMAINRLVEHGHSVVAVGLKKGVVAGINITPEKEPFENINTVTMYLNPKRQEEYYDYILSLKPERVVFNPGTENPDFYKILKENNIENEVACTLVLLSTNQY